MSFLGSVAFLVLASLSAQEGSVPAESEPVPGTDIQLLAEVRRAAERVEEVRGETFERPPVAVRAPAETQAVAAEIRIVGALAGPRLAARGRAWEDVGLGLADTPGKIYRLLAQDLDGVSVDPTDPRLLVDPERFTTGDFVPEEGGREPAELLLMTGVRPDEPLVVHALVHLLQRQRTGPGAWPETSDALWTSRAWAEGEANLVALRYLFRGMELEDVILEQPLDPGTVMDGRLLPHGLAGSSGPVADLADWVYREGYEAAVASFRRGSWTGLARDVSVRPCSRDLMHLEREPLAPDRIDESRPGGTGDLELVDRDTLGEIGIAVTISMWTGKENLGLMTADGWSGDALFRWEGDDPEAGVTVWITRWISETEARDFEYGYLRGLETRFPSVPRKHLPEGGSRLVHRGRALVITRNAREVRVEVGPDSENVPRPDPAGDSGL